MTAPATMHRLRKLVRRIPLASLALLLLCLAQTGCLAVAAGAAAGAGAYAYYQGEHTEVHAAEFGQAYQSAKRSLAERGLPIRYEHHNGLTGTIESSIEDGSKVTITLEEKPRLLASDGHQTEVGIRVGTFGDSRFSKELQQSIRTGMNGVPSGTRLPAVNTAIQQTGATVPAPNKTEGWKPVGGTNGSVGNTPPP
jgi:hypothetical protein